MMKRQDKFIQQLTAVQTALAQVDRALDDFHSTLIDEYQAVAEHSIKKLESVGQRKAMQADQLQLLLKNMQQGLVTLIPLYQEVLPEAFVPSPSLSDWASLLEKLAQLGESGQMQAVFQVQVQETVKLLRRYQEKFWHIKPEIEKNRFIVARLLRNHQESYKFWQSTVNELSSSYDRCGLRRAPESISQFQVKA